MLRRAIAVDFLSIRLSVRRVDCDKTKQSSVNTLTPCDGATFLALNVVVLSLGFHPNECVKDKYPLLKAQIWPITYNNMETEEDMM